jgi:hypothetical protein
VSEAELVIDAGAETVDENEAVSDAELVIDAGAELVEENDPVREIEPVRTVAVANAG